MRPDFDHFDHGSRSSMMIDEAPGSLSLYVTELDDEVVVHLRGELDMATAPLFAECLQRLPAAHGRTAVIDVSHLEFCDSSGLSVLIAHRRRVQQDGTRLAVRAPSDALRRLLELTHLDDLIEDPDPRPGDGQRQ